MCGVMGFVRTKGWNKGTARFLTALMIGIEIRGDHASGVAWLPRPEFKKMLYGKKPCPATEFISSQWWASAMDSKSDALIGHARWATHGTVNNPINNHPHVSGNRRFAIVHNGIVAEDVNVKISGQCDSEKILSLIQRSGVKGALGKLTATKYASYAVLALDTKERILHAFRNERSPMVVADMTEQIGGIVFCSTLEILEDALSVCDIAKEPQVYSIIPDIDFTFPCPCAPGLEALKLPIATYQTTYLYKSGSSAGVATTRGYRYYTDSYDDYDYDEGWTSRIKKPNLTEKERRQRLHMLANDETPLDFKLERDGRIYKTWKEYFADHPECLGKEAEQKTLPFPEKEKEELKKMAEQLSGYDEI